MVKESSCGRKGEKKTYRKETADAYRRCSGNFQRPLVGKVDGRRVDGEREKERQKEREREREALQVNKRARERSVD